MISAFINRYSYYCSHVLSRYFLGVFKLALVQILALFYTFEMYVSGSRDRSHTLMSFLTASWDKHYGFLGWTYYPLRFYNVLFRYISLVIKKMIIHGWFFK